MNALPLANKSILFIGIGFYDYEEAIRHQLLAYGATVDYHLQEPRWHQSALRRRAARAVNIGLDESLDRHLQRLIQLAATKQFDYVFVIKGNLLHEQFIAELRRHQEHSYFVLYQWDSLSRVPQAMKLLPYFDRVLSFDRRDCVERPEIVFRPLFYRAADSQRDFGVDRQFDFIFVGWLHSDRFDLLLELDANLRSRGFRVYFYLYTGIGTYLRHLLRGRHRLLHFRRLAFDEVARLVCGSRCVIDIPHLQQSGLTMRSIEAMGLSRKLVTTNSDVVNYDFFDSANVLSVNSLNADAMANFVATPYHPVPAHILAGYRLDSWVKDVFGLSDFQ